MWFLVLFYVAVLQDYKSVSYEVYNELKRKYVGFENWTSAFC